MSKLSWNSLFANGSIVALTISEWRARTKIKAADLGIDDTEAVREALSLGQHRLAPKDAFDDITDAARGAKRSIDHFSLNFALIQGARYVPDNNIELLMERLVGYRTQFDNAVEAFIEKYDEMKAEQLPKIREALIEAAKTEEAAANAYERILSEYPTAEQVRDKFRLRWSVYAVQGAKSNAALEALGSEAEEVKSVVSSMVGQLRNELTDKLESIITIATKGGRLSDRSIDSALELFDRLEGLNILEDQSLAENINMARNLLESVEDKTVKKGFTEELTSIKKELVKSQEQAVKDAESALIGLGRRKLS